MYALSAARKTLKFLSLVRAVSPQAKFRSLRPERLDINERVFANHINYDSGAGFLQRFPEFKWLLVSVVSVSKIDVAFL